MADVKSLLPSRASTPVMRAIEQAIAYDPRLAPSIDNIRNIKGRRLPAWLQFLLYEYGLIELTPYVASPYTLLDEGRLWQIERDTWAAVTRGLGWVNAPGSIVEAAERRNWWNSFQIYLESLPPADSPNLLNIEKIVGLSSPYRSDFRRGVYYYDAPALEGDTTRLDRTLLDAESGVRMHAGGPLWSLGRLTERQHVMTEAEGTAIGNWISVVNDAPYFVKMTAPLLATVSDAPIDIDDAIEFSRVGTKWHDDAAGVWHSFADDVIAATDRGSLIEGEADRICLFLPQSNALSEDAALVVASGLADPLGGNEAIRVIFDADAGRTLYIPAESLANNTVYSVSFFAKLISATGFMGGDGDAGLHAIFGQMVTGVWKRIVGPSFTTGIVDGEWIDLTLAAPGTTLTVELYGFQLETGPRVSSPIYGDEITGHREPDELSLILPTGLNNVVVKFDDNSVQSFLSVEGTYPIDAADLNRPLITEIKTANSSTWVDMAFPWDSADFPWISDLSLQRAIVLAQWFEGKLAYIRFKDGSGNVIGYRRSRASIPVKQLYGGPYSFGLNQFVPGIGADSVYFEAMTAAGDGAPVTAKSLAVMIGSTLADGVKPGKLWLEPDELVGGTALAVKAIDLPLRATVRERTKILLRF